jgi:hypothetical protein
VGVVSGILGFGEWHPDNRRCVLALDIKSFIIDVGSVLQNMSVNIVGVILQKQFLKE